MCVEKKRLKRKDKKVYYVSHETHFIR